ncbi:MAG TPA: histidine phosphatase family protein [Acidimicrobiales bacterium]|nr:histidine phosphatase family protein [Acidimicrobiales bacterium]
MAEYRQLRFEPPPGATTVLLVRHGESEPLDDDRPFPLIEGQGDPALAAEGIEQAYRVSDRLVLEGVDAVYVTSLCRTVQTAAPLVKRLGLDPVVEPDLREVFLGEWEGGLLRKMMREQGPLARRVLAEQRWEIVPGAESATTFSGRVRRGLERIAVAHPDQHVALFTHGGVVGELLAQATGSDPFAFTGADNGSISEIVVSGPRWIVRRFNDTTHLDGGPTRRLGVSPEN